MGHEVSLFRGPSGLERAKEIIERMHTHDIPPTPPNYEIWTGYVAGSPPELCREIETRLTSGDAFTDEVNDELFERFFANTRLSIQMLEASGLIARELDGAVSNLRGAGSHASSYATLLKTAAERFEGGVDSDAFRAMVKQLAVSTHEMAEQNLKLVEQIEASSRQVEELQAALQAVKVEALTDGLTGLANRRMFDETLQRRVEEATTSSGELCVALLEIDNLRRITDNWGHSLGDQVLRYIASTLRAHAQGDVMAARIANEEFALIMPRTNVNLGEALTARVARAVKSKRLSVKSTGDVIGEITLSIGVARFQPGDAATGLVTRATACLDAAKAQGRDRSVTDLQLARQQSAV